MPLEWSRHRCGTPDCMSVSFQQGYRSFSMYVREDIGRFSVVLVTNKETPPGRITAGSLRKR